jgi:hypothetical protein
MNEYMWGVVTGAVATPFVWVTLKWCMTKLKSALGKA